MSPHSIQFEACLPDPQSTDRLGGALAEALLGACAVFRKEGLAVRLIGDLGAGKTSLVRALLRALSYEGPVKSPTFSLLESYDVRGLKLHHFDFYRFEDPMEFMDAGFRELFGAGAVCLTEWSDRAEPYLPPADLEIRIRIDGFGRRAEVSSSTEAGSAVAAIWVKTWNSTADA